MQRTADTDDHDASPPTPDVETLLAKVGPIDDAAAVHLAAIVLIESRRAAVGQLDVA